MGTDNVELSPDDNNVNKFTITQGFRALRVDGDSDKTSNKLVNILSSKADNKHGHAEIAVVNSIKQSELKLFITSNEFIELTNSPIDAGGKEQNIDGDSEYML